MNKTGWRFGKVTAVATMLPVAGSAMVALATPASAQSPPDIVVETPFAAVSADSCGYTRGVLGFHLGGPVVDVTGRLIDHPTTPDPAAPCAGNPAISVATYVAYARESIVDRRAVTADNQDRPVDFSLTNQVGTAPIEKVVIQVCRFLPPSGPPVRCGRAVEYRAPIS